MEVDVIDSGYNKVLLKSFQFCKVVINSSYRYPQR